MSDCRYCENYGSNYCKCHWISNETFEEYYKNGQCPDYEETQE